MQATASTKRSVFLEVQMGGESQEFENESTKNRLKPNELELKRIETILREVVRDMTHLEVEEKTMRDLNGKSSTK